MLLLLVLGVLCIPQAGAQVVPSTARRYGDMKDVGTNPFENEDEQQDDQRTDSLPKRIRKPLESYFFSDSIRALPNFAWNIDPYSNNVEVKGLDTLLYDYRIDYPFLRKGVGDVYLGNLGGATIPLDFFDRPDGRNFSFTRAFDAYLFDVSNVDFFNVKRPFSLLSYGSAGQKRHLEENFAIVHAQNISPSSGFNINYKSRGTRGIYTWQRSRDKDLSIAFSHTGKRYSIHAGYIYNSVDLRENGGLIDDRDVTDTVYELPSNVPMKLQDATNVLKNNVFYVVQSYALPMRRLTDDDFSVADLSSLYVGHAFEYNRWYRRYEDTRAGTQYKNSDRWDPEAQTRDYYENWFINPEQTNDSTFESLLSNRIFVQLQPWDRNGVVGTIDGGIALEHHHYYQMGMEQYLDGRKKGVTETSYHVYGAVKGKFRRYLDWGADVKFYPSGYRGGDLSLSGRLSATAFIKGHPVTLSGKIGDEKRSPDYWSEHYFSNHYAWFTPLNKETETRLEISLTAPRYGAVVRFRQSLLSDRIYLGADRRMTQESGNVSVTGLYAQKDFRFGGLHLDHRVLLQWSSNQEVVPVPAASAYLSYYYEFNVVKNVLRMQLGLDGRYNTKYYAFGYDPALAMFYNQREKKIGGYPMIDVFMACKWKRMRILLKMQHLNDDLIGGRRYFSALHYPLNKRIVKLSFSWGFYD